MSKYLLMILIACLGFDAMAQAQKEDSQIVPRLNVHRKDGGVEQYLFSEKPEVKYVGSTMLLTTATLSVEYPLAELARLTFTDVKASAIPTLQVSSQPAATVRIYDGQGFLLRTIEPVGGSTVFSLEGLPSGVLIIKNGTTTYKIFNQ